MSLLKPEVKREWVKALRSGKYAQAQLALRNRRDEYCCLGVLSDKVDPDGWEWKKGNWYHLGQSELPSGITRSILAVPSEQNIYDMEKHYRDLAEMNDDEQMTFDQIANWIEKNL